MSDEFSGLDFALGTVRGFRRWKVNVDGVLEPLSWTGKWMPGENVAHCKAHPSKDQIEPKREGEAYTDYFARIEAWRGDHDYVSCKHGFYAYFDGREGDTYSSNAPTVSGVIEGYGEVLIGTKGFRATKARVLALSFSPHAGIWRLEQFVKDRIAENYPGVALFEAEMPMRLEFPAPQQYATV